MACVLYDKSGAMILCEISEVDYYLQNGYLKDDPLAIKPLQLGTQPSADLDKEITDKIAELEGQLDSKDEEIRALAREKGIARVGKKNIDTLLKEIEALEDAAEN